MEQNQRETKRCPYCGEEIMATAKKCRYCGSWLTDNGQPTSNPHTDNEQHTDQIQAAEAKRESRPNVVASLIILTIAAFMAIGITVAMYDKGGGVSYNSGNEIGNDTVEVVDTMCDDTPDAYPISDYHSDESMSDDSYSESTDDSNPYCEAYFRCKGKFVDDWNTPIELQFSIDEAGGISGGSVIARQSNQRFDDLTGYLSGNHLDMTFANGSSSVSLDIEGNGKMSGTIEGTEVILHFTIQHS